MKKPKRADEPPVSSTIPIDEHGRKIYRPDGVVLRAFLRDTSHVSIIRGSIGSGTSTASLMKMWKLACEQRPGPDGLRRTRWGVIRNTYPDLRGTTIKTWLDWFPEEKYGRFYWDRPYRHIIRLGDVEMEVTFLALDSPDDVSKLRSLEATGFWFNELEFIDKAIVDEAESRTGRYPAVKDGGCSWDGVIADMNAPSEDHWIPLMMGETPPPEDMTEEEQLAYRKPHGWSYFVQPPAMLEVRGPDGRIAGYEINPEAENLKWLKPGYYEEKVQGKSLDWIKGHVLNQITVLVDGRPVWPMFNAEAHLSKEPLKPVPNWPVLVGLDFGRRPAAVFAQLVNGRWQVLKELIGADMGASTFAPMVKRVLEQEFAGHEFKAWGDPKGADGVQSDERTAYDVFRSFGIPVLPAPVKQNNINTRIEAVEFVLNGMMNGRPRFLLSPSCRTLKVAMQGGYHYKRKQSSSTQHHDAPEKDRYSDIADALQYLILGAGEGRQMMGLTADVRTKPVNTRPTRSRRRVAA